MMKLTIDLIFLIVAVIVGILTGRRTQPQYLKLLPYFLLLTLLVELVGQWYQERNRNNTLLFNLYSVTEFFFFSYFFSKAIPGNRYKKNIAWVKYILATICLVNIFLLQGPNVFHTYTFSLGCLIMVLLGLFYFYQLFHSDSMVNLLQEPAFWISIAVIFFFVCSISLLGALNNIASLPKMVINNLEKILMLVNCFFYLILTFAFLCQLTRRKRSSSL